MQISFCFYLFFSIFSDNKINPSSIIAHLKAKPNQSSPDCFCTSTAFSSNNLDMTATNIHFKLCYLTNIHQQKNVFLFPHISTYHIFSCILKILYNNNKTSYVSCCWESAKFSQRSSIPRQLFLQCYC